MSKRFGRTQKRKLRAKVAELEAKGLQFQKRLNEKEHNMEALFDMANLLRKIIPHSALLPPETVTRMGQDPMYKVPLIASVNMSNIGSASMALDLEFTNSVLYEVSIGVRPIPENLSLLLHLNVHNGESIRYFMTHDTIYRYKDLREVRERVLRMFDTEIKHYLSNRR